MLTAMKKGLRSSSIGHSIVHVTSVELINVAGKAKTFTLSPAPRMHDRPEPAIIFDATRRKVVGVPARMESGLRLCKTGLEEFVVTGITKMGKVFAFVASVPKLETVRKISPREEGKIVHIIDRPSAATKTGG